MLDWPLPFVRNARTTEKSMDSFIYIEMLRVNFTVYILRSRLLLGLKKNIELNDLDIGIFTVKFLAMVVFRLVFLK